MDAGKPAKALVVIGARAGSKGVPDKNIRKINGIPLLGIIVRIAKAARLIDKVVVSTDSPKYAEIAREFGAEVPFLRPTSMSRDDSLEREYVLHAVNWLRENENFRADFVVRLQPTSPFQLPEDVDASVRLLSEDPLATSCMVVAEAKQPPVKAMKVAPDGRYLAPYFQEVQSLEVVNRQSVPKAYFRANVIASRVSHFVQTGEQIGSKCRYHVIDPNRALDIDTEQDFEVAQSLSSKYLGWLDA